MALLHFTVLKKIKEYLILTLGAFFTALALNMFLVPFQLSSGGIGTIGVVLLYFFKIPLSATNLVFNIVLFGFGINLLKKNSVIKTIYGIIVLSACLQITSYLPQFKEDIFLAMVLGGFFDGLGMGLVLSVDGSTGGIDFAALMVKRKFSHISMADFMLFVNCAMYVISGIVFKSYLVTFYSMIAMFISAKVTDYVINVGDNAKAIMVVTENSSEIETMILNDFGRRATEIYSRGALTEESTKMLICVAKPRETPKIIKQTKQIDEKAFLFVYDVKEVFGKGFKLDDCNKSV